MENNQPSRIYFVKMHGLGNDFVVINKQDLVIKDKDLSQIAKGIADRRIGIGCDQVIIYEETSDICEMIIYNIDGSSAKMCGNATRCLAQLIHLKSGKHDIVITSGNRKLVCKVENDGDISVGVEAVGFQEEWMPSADKIWEFAMRYNIEIKEIVCVDVGNPHLVIFDNLAMKNKMILGEMFQKSEIFPDGVNVSFADVKDNKIHLMVWERGAGLTLACGSAACASFAAGIKLGKIESPAEIVFKHGSLVLKVDQGTGPLVMKGPAKLVARGKYYCK